MSSRLTGRSASLDVETKSEDTKASSPAMKPEEYVRRHQLPLKKLRKKAVHAYVRDLQNPERHRVGLAEAWNAQQKYPAQRVTPAMEAERARGLAAHARKLERETSNKNRGDAILSTAVDSYRTRKMEGEVAIQGFRLIGNGKGQVAVAVSRSTGRHEARAMRSTGELQRREHTDPYKWFSESAAHTAKFVNNSSAETGSRVVVWLDADQYLDMRRGMQHEFGSSGAARNRFHQENVSDYPHLINVGIHAAEEEAFNRAIVDVSQFAGAGRQGRRVDDLPEIARLSEPEPPRPFRMGAEAPSQIRMSGQELLYAHAAGFRQPDALRDWRASEQYALYRDAASRGPIPPAQRDQILEQFRKMGH